MNGYLDIDIAIQNAVNAGCRMFVLEIDYFNDCTSPDSKYYPRLVVRDKQGKLIINPVSLVPFCDTSSKSTISDVCNKINFYAFASSCQNASDPVIIVLYFLRQPPGSYKSSAVLDYFSHVATAISSAFSTRLLTNELQGGTFYRQKQESNLLIGNITNYSGKVLIFNNANTNGFREVQSYASTDDLDFLTNLRLSYTQTSLGITDNSTTTQGILETAEDYMAIPSDRVDDFIESIKQKWTICLSSDPSIPVGDKSYKKITSDFGVNCIPICIFDDANKFMFSDGTFKTYSFIPKKKPLRYIKPAIAIPAEPNPSMNANGGILRAPILG
jgi:hypothetical protein